MPFQQISKFRRHVANSLVVMLLLSQKKKKKKSVLLFTVRSSAIQPHRYQLLGRPPNHQGDHTVADLSRNGDSSRGDVDKVVDLEVVSESNRMPDCDVRHEVFVLA